MKDEFSTAMKDRLVYAVVSTSDAIQEVPGSIPGFTRNFSGSIGSVTGPLTNRSKIIINRL